MTVINRAMLFGASAGGTAIAASGPLGAGMCAGTGAALFPGLVNPAVAFGGLLAGSFLFNLVAIPVVGGLFGWSLMASMSAQENIAVRFLAVAVIAGTVALSISSAIAVAALSAAGSPVTFGALALCTLAGAAVILGGSAILGGLCGWLMEPCLDRDSGFSRQF